MHALPQIYIKIKYLIFLFELVQSVNLVKYTDEEYEKYLTDPVGINSRLLLYYLKAFNLQVLIVVLT